MEARPWRGLALPLLRVVAPSGRRRWAAAPSAAAAASSAALGRAGARGAPSRGQAPPGGRARAAVPTACALGGCRLAGCARRLRRAGRSRPGSSRAAGPGDAGHARVSLVSAEPLILVVDGLCSPRLVAELRGELGRGGGGGLEQTGAYVDDMFEEERELREDALFRSCVSLSGAAVPGQYAQDPLRSVLWVARTQRERLPPGSVRQIQQAVARRAWTTQWNPEDVARSGFRKAASRWRVPSGVLRRLAPLVVQILGTGVEGIPGSQELPASPRSDVKWILRDSTVVRYRQGESQVPHLDTCDLTLLVFLSRAGGCTAFPNLRQVVPPEEGRVLVFFSTTPEATRFGGFAGAAYGRPNDATMHYGSLGQLGDGEEKLVVQLLLSVEDLGGSGAEAGWKGVLGGPLFHCARYSSSWAPPAAAHREAFGARRGARGALALCSERCASACEGPALDLAAGPGGQKFCVWCWSRWLEECAAA